MCYMQVHDKRQVSSSLESLSTDQRLLTRSDGGSDVRLPSVMGILGGGDIDQSLNHDRNAISPSPTKYSAQPWLGPFKLLTVIWRISMGWAGGLKGLRARQ